MKLWILSDLHLEINTHTPIYNTLEYDVAVIAGDYHKTTKVISHAMSNIGRTKPIVMVAGNHEHYFENSVPHNIAKLQTNALNTNVSFLENSTAIIDGVRFIGATLWTDYNLYNDYKTHSDFAHLNMNDFYTILGNNSYRLTPAEVSFYFKCSFEYIKTELQKPHFGKTVVITHHLPSHLSIHAQYANSPLNPSFASDCKELLDLQPDFWIHGHTHTSVNYMYGKTRVLCNPRGYYNLHRDKYENSEFNPKFVIEI
jgi:predicted phosphodiesterase